MDLRKSSFYVIVLCTLLLSISSTQAAWVFWSNDSPSGNLWSDAANWTATPTGGDDVVVGRDHANGALVNAGTAAAGNWIHISSSETGGSLLTVEGGTVTCDHFIVGENWDLAQQGTLNMTGGTISANLLMIGGGTSGTNGAGTVNVSGGTINLGWMLALGGGYNGVTGNGSGTLNITGGTVNALGGGSLVMSDNGTVNIAGGTLVLAGEVTDVTVYGNVIANGGTGSFAYDFDGSNTAITAVPEPATVVLLGLAGVLLRKRK